MNRDVSFSPRGHTPEGVRKPENEHNILENEVQFAVIITPIQPIRTKVRLLSFHSRFDHLVIIEIIVIVVVFMIISVTEK